MKTSLIYSTSFSSTFVIGMTLLDYLPLLPLKDGSSTSPGYRKKLPEMHDLVRWQFFSLPIHKTLTIYKPDCSPGRKLVLQLFQTSSTCAASTKSLGQFQGEQRTQNWCMVPRRTFAKAIVILQNYPEHNQSASSQIGLTLLPMPSEPYKAQIALKVFLTEYFLFLKHFCSQFQNLWNQKNLKNFSAVYRRTCGRLSTNLLKIYVETHCKQIQLLMQSSYANSSSQGISLPLFALPCQSPLL